MLAIMGLGALSLGSLSANAEGFRCATRDGKSSLSATTAYETGYALTSVPVLVVAGQTVKVEESQYKNIDGELFFYSVMDEQNAEGIPTNRVVRLDVKYDDNGIGRGTLNVHRDFGGRIVEPVKLNVNCKVD